jgi:monofunctional chorismate mutase
MELSEIRKNIDRIDAELIKLLVKRFELMPKVAAYKKQNNIPIDVPKREKAIIEKKSTELKELGFNDSKFAHSFFSLIIEKSKEIQRRS